MTCQRPPIPTLDEIIRKLNLPVDLLNIECCDEYLFYLSDIIDNWRSYADVLGLKQHEINEIHSDVSLNSRHKCQKMLQHWHNHYGYKATYLELMRAFVKMENAKLAQTVGELFLSTYYFKTIE